jgi:ribosomal protein S18 acetylase RimI-like enzyme
MNVELKIRAARRDDAPAIVDIIRDSFQKDLLAMFLYGCSGIEKFVTEQIAIQCFGGETFYTVAQIEDQIMGCAEMRRFQSRLFLNYIAIRPAYRSRDYAKQLLHDTIQLSEPNNRKIIDLDVLESNSVARAWYRAIGFEDQYSTYWLTYPSLAGGNAPVLISGYAQAQVCQREYGFSRFSITTQGREYEVGRLGDALFRLSDPQAIYSSELAGTLKKIDPHREILLLSASLPTSPNLPQCQVRARTFRQTINIETLMRNLNSNKSLTY